MKILVDSREQLPYTFEGYPDVTTETVGLETGDYTIEGYEDVFVIERKSLPDLMGTMTRGRNRFQREMDRAADMGMFEVVIEASRDQIESGDYRSQMNPNAAIGSIKAWSRPENIRFVYANDRVNAERYTYGRLIELREYYEGLAF